MSFLPNLFILNNSGDVLIEKNFIGATRRLVCELFWEEVQKHATQSQVRPIIPTGHGYHLLSVRRCGMFFLTAVDDDVDVLLVIECLHMIVSTLLMYFREKLTDQIIRDNFALIYQLLDEVIVGSFPHTTEHNQLTDMISPPSAASTLTNQFTGRFTVKGVLPSAFASPKTPWRKPDTKYVTNEIKLDIVESIDAIIQGGPSQETIVTSEISGDIQANCRLSGDPDLVLLFNSPRILDQVQLHRCVRISRWQKERVISFVPPDGKFSLMKYRLPNSGQMPIAVFPTIAYRDGRADVKVVISKQNTQGKQVDKLAVEIPFPAETHSFTLSANVGKVSTDEITKIVRWIIGRYPKDKTPTLTGTVGMPLDIMPDSKPTMKATFEIKAISMSNLKIDSLAVHGVKYRPFKGVRHILRSGNFLVRA